MLIHLAWFKIWRILEIEFRPLLRDLMIPGCQDSKFKPMFTPHITIHGTMAQRIRRPLIHTITVQYLACLISRVQCSVMNES